MKPLSLNTIEGSGNSAADIGKAEHVDGEGFGATLKSAIEKVDVMQTEADVEA